MLVYEGQKYCQIPERGSKAYDFNEFNEVNEHMRVIERKQFSYNWS